MTEKLKEIPRNELQMTKQCGKMDKKNITENCRNTTNIENGQKWTANGENSSNICNWVKFFVEIQCKSQNFFEKHREISCKIKTNLWKHLKIFENDKSNGQALGKIRQKLMKTVWDLNFYAKKKMEFEENSKTDRISWKLW